MYCVYGINISEFYLFYSNSLISQNFVVLLMLRFCYWFNLSFCDVFVCGKNDQLEQRIDQYREQMEIQRQTYSTKQDQNSDFLELLRKKDKEMNAVLDQIEVCIPLYYS